MKIELFIDRDLRIPTPFFKDTNEVAIELVDFIIVRELHPTKIHKLLKSPGTKRLQDTLHRVVFLINQLAEQQCSIADKNDKKQAKVGISYLEATYESNMKPLIDALRRGAWDEEAQLYVDGWKEESLQQYVKDWRTFYRYLDYRGTPHNMFMPATIQREYKTPSEQNFLSHTNYDASIPIETETAVHQRLIEPKIDFSDNVISLNDFYKLYAELEKDDEVFAAMAIADITTFLRISALVNDFPLFPTQLNPAFKPYPVALRDAGLNNSEYQSQDISFINKGGSIKKCMLIADVHQEIHEKYITAKTVSYEERKQKFQKEYCKKKYAEKRRIEIDMKFSWLKRNGTPVTPASYRRALKKACNQLNIYCHPHMLRHTGATLVVYEALKSIIGKSNFGAITDIVIHEVHKAVQDQLCHKDIETTRMYIRTVEKFTRQAKLAYWLEQAMNKAEKSEALTLNSIYKKGIENWKNTQSL